MDNQTEILLLYSDVKRNVEACETLHKQLDAGQAGVEYGSIASHYVHPQAATTTSNVFCRTFTSMSARHTSFVTVNGSSVCPPTTNREFRQTKEAGRNTADGAPS